MTGPTRFSALMDQARAEPGVPARYGRTRRESADYVAQALFDAYERAGPLGLRTHQAEAAAFLAHQASAVPLTGAVVVIPPSGGKTRTWTSAVAHMALDGWMPSVAVLLPTRWHVRQALSDIARRHPDLPVGHQASGLDKGHGPSRARSVAPLTLFTYRSFAKWARDGDIVPDDVDMLVLDDAHAGLERGASAWLSPFLREVPCAAFVPTPGLDGEGPPVSLGPEAPVHEASALELRNRGDIAPVINYVLAVDVANAGPDDRGAMRAAMAEAALDFMASEPDLAAAVAERATLFHAPFVDEARAFAEGFNARFATPGRRMEVLTSEDGDDRVRKVLKDAATGSVAGVASAKLVAIDGIHFPDVGVVVNAATESSSLSLQRSGRVQAVPEGAPARTGFVVDAFLRLDGVVEGRPRFYHEVAPNVVARLVEADPYDLAARGADPAPPAEAPEAVAAGADAQAAGVPEPSAEPAGAPAAPVSGQAGHPAEPGDEPVSAEAWAPDPAGASAATDDASAGTARSGTDPAPGTVFLARINAPGGRQAPGTRGFSVTSSLEELVRLVRARDLYHDAPPPVPGHLDLTGARSRLGASGRAAAQIGAAYRELEDKLARGLEPSWGEFPVRAAPGASGGRKSIWVHPDDVDRLGRSLLLAPSVRDAGPDDLRQADVEAALGLRGHPAVRTAFARMVSDWIGGGVVREGRPVGFDLVRPASGTPALAIARADLPVLSRDVERLRPAPAAPGEMGLTQALGRILPGRRPTPRDKEEWRAIQDEAASGAVPPDDTGLVPARIALADGKETLVLRESGLPWLAERLGHPFNGVLAHDPGAFPVLSDCAVRLGIRPDDPTLASVFADCRDDHARGVPVTLGGLSYMAAWVRSGTGVALGIPAGAVPALAAEIETRRAGLEG